MEHGHSGADARNLHLHRAAVEKLRRSPELVEPCLRLVNRWLSVPEQPARRWLFEWQEMLAHWSVDQLADVVLDEVRGQTLRQCSPLGPLLTPRERWRLLEEIGRGPTPRQEPAR